MQSISGELIEILCFKHFARYKSFALTGKQGRNKQIMNGILNIVNKSKKDAYFQNFSER